MIHINWLLYDGVLLQTKLLGQMLYYILTTGAGQQTLGEEYCDIVQVMVVLIEVAVYGLQILCCLTKRLWL